MEVEKDEKQNYVVDIELSDGIIHGAGILCNKDNSNNYTNNGSNYQAFNNSYNHTNIHSDIYPDNDGRKAAIRWYIHLSS